MKVNTMYIIKLSLYFANIFLFAFLVTGMIINIMNNVNMFNSIILLPLSLFLLIGMFLIIVNKHL